MRLLRDRLIERDQRGRIEELVEDDVGKRAGGAPALGQQRKIPASKVDHRPEFMRNWRSMKPILIFCLAWAGCDDNPRPATVNAVRGKYLITAVLACGDCHT